MTAKKSAPTSAVKASGAAKAAAANTDELSTAVAATKKTTAKSAAKAADADAGADVKHAWRRLRGGLIHRRQRTHALSARDGFHPGAKQ